MNAKVDRANLSRRMVLQERTAGAMLDDAVKITIIRQTLENDIRIPIDFLDAPLEYTIPQGTEPQDPDDLIEFKIRKKGAPDWEDIEEYLELGPIVDRVWPLPREIPTKYLVEDIAPEIPTVFEVKYIYWYGGINQSNAEIAEYAVDRTRPYKVKVPASDRTPAAPSFPAGPAPGAPIDEVFLGQNPTGVRIKIADYSARLDSDWVELFFGVAPDPDRDEPAYKGFLTSTFEVLVPVEKFRAAEEGANTFVYRVRDLARNISKLSNASTRSIVFLEDPNVILPPIVPLANGENGDDLIDHADCEQGVKVNVTVPIPNGPGDSVRVYWGSEEVGSEKLVGTNLELTWDVDVALIESVYGNTDGAENTNIHFEMFRGNRKIAESSADIFVDMSYIGPENPDKPKPINPNLSTPELTMPKGSVNEILEADYGDNGTISFMIFAAPPTEEGWEIKIFYHNVQVGATIALTPGMENTRITRQLDWDVIFQQESGSRDLWWTLNTPLGVNPQSSPLQPITVADFPIETAAPQVLNLAGPLQQIGCGTLNFGASNDGTARRDLQVLILKGPYTVDGETITLKWEALSNASPPVPIVETTKDYPIVGAFPDGGAIINIGTYDTHFKPANRGIGRLTYTVTRTGSTPTPPSKTAQHGVLLVNHVGQYCEEANP